MIPRIPGTACTFSINAYQSDGRSKVHFRGHNDYRTPGTNWGILSSRTDTAIIAVVKHVLIVIIKE